MKFLSQKHGNKEITLKSVNVFLGANGSGKSTVLNEIRDGVSSIMPGKKAVYVEGGRTISLKNSLRLNPQNVRNYEDYDKAKNTYEGKRQQSLSARVYDALMVLERKELAIKARHSDAVDKWTTGGQNGLCPVREKPPLERLFGLFTEIFPRLQIEYDPNAKSLKVRKGVATYSIEAMSDGEKQAFSILADFVELGDEYELIVVDEPELNLHPELAERIWNLIESEFPDRAYCYATHSLSFAMRPQVEKIIVLSDDSDNVTEIDDVLDVSSLDLFEFLGSIPGIIAAESVVVTEGREKSFDSIFYRWLLGDNQIEVMPAGDCEQVKLVCKREGVWSRIAPKVKLTGVIDQDLRTEDQGPAIVLDFREAESYLAIPALAVASDRHLSVNETRLVDGVVIEMILRHLADERLIISANYVGAHCGIRLGVSAERSLVRNCADLTQLKQHLCESSSNEVAKAIQVLGHETVSARVDEINIRIDQVLAANDWNEALKLIDGKRIGNAIAKTIGVRNATDLIRSISSNISVDSIPETKSIASRLKPKEPNKTLLLTPDPPPVPAMAATALRPCSTLAPGQA